MATTKRLGSLSIAVWQSSKSQYGGDRCIWWTCERLLLLLSVFPAAWIWDIQWWGLSSLAKASVLTCVLSGAMTANIHMSGRERASRGAALRTSRWRIPNSDFPLIRGNKKQSREAAGRPRKHTRGGKRDGQIKDGGIRWDGREDRCEKVARRIGVGVVVVSPCGYH